MPLSAEKRKKAKKMIAKFLKEKKDENQKRIKAGFLSENENMGVIHKLPTGLLSIDILTNGGLAKGHVNLIYGGESAGKTTTFFNIIKTCQQEIDDFLAAYASSEKSLDRDYAEYVGVDNDDLVVIEGETAENNTDFCVEAADPENGYDLLVVDTLQALSAKQELYKGDSTNLRSTEDNSMALLPRVYSQFFRMYTSKSVGQLTLILGSQIRADLSNPMFVKKKQTGGNALGHYNLITIEMVRLADSNWPTGRDNIPPNSFVVQLKLDKAKIGKRYRGNSIKMYFKEGKFERKMNVLAIAKDLGLTDGKTVKYMVPNQSTGDSVQDHIEFKARGFNDMYNRIPDEAIDWLEQQLNDEYTKQVNAYETNNEGDE